MKHIFIGLWMTALLFALLFVIENIFSQWNLTTLIPSMVFLVINFSILSFTKDENKR